MNTSAKGARAERRARRMLEADGFCVVRAGGSLGRFDLVAFNRERLRLVQVKSNRNASAGERTVLAAFDNAPSHATREVWIFRDREREPEIEVLP